MPYLQNVELGAPRQRLVQLLNHVNDDLDQLTRSQVLRLPGVSGRAKCILTRLAGHV